LGGSRTGEDSESGGHTVINNVAWNNRAIGFDQNGGGAMTLQNNTAFDNGSYAYGFFDGDHSFANNAALGSGRVATSGSSQNNSWDFGFTLASSDFASLNPTTATGSRTSDGSLPLTDFLALSSTSRLIDKGLDFGRAFTGGAPDLGAFELGAPPPATSTPPAALATPVRASAPTPVAEGSPATPADSVRTYGTDEADRLMGSSGNDYLHGNGGSDHIDGGAGRDELRGGSGDDILIGGLGADILHGGDGRDTFTFRHPGESGIGSGARDVIRWFQPGTDKINVSLIDANTAVAGNQVFAFAGASSSVQPNALTYVHSDKSTIIQGDVNGDTTADFEIELNALVSLNRSHFTL
jgi:Ca2+-binding RTX toxin-like protein